VLLAKGDKAGAAAEYQAGFATADAQLKADPDNVQRTVDAAYSHFKLAVAGVDSARNFHTALDMLTKLKSDGHLPGANEPWIAMVENGMKQAGVE